MSITVGGVTYEEEVSVLAAEVIAARCAMGRRGERTSACTNAMLTCIHTAADVLSRSSIYERARVCVRVFHSTGA